MNRTSYDEMLRLDAETRRPLWLRRIQAKEAERQARCRAWVWRLGIVAGLIGWVLVLFRAMRQG